MFVNYLLLAIEQVSAHTTHTTLYATLGFVAGVIRFLDAHKQAPRQLAAKKDEKDTGQFLLTEQYLVELTLRLCCLPYRLALLQLKNHHARQRQFGAAPLCRF